MSHQVELFNTSEDIPGRREKFCGMIDWLAERYAVIAGWDPRIFLEKREEVNFWDEQYLDKTGEEGGMVTPDALRCLVDIPRTYALVCGIGETMKEIKKIRDGEKVIGIDAGTGTGILAMAMAANGCDEVYALEVNPQTVVVTQKLVEELGLASQIKVIKADATKIQLSGLKADVVVSENLSNGLLDEPQMQIINNLSRFLREGGQIIPYGISLFAALGRSEWRQKEGKNSLTAWKLNDLQWLTDKINYVSFFCERGLNLTSVQRRVMIPFANGEQQANTLIISSGFQINNLGKRYDLCPDEARFLGRSTAFRLPGNIQAIDGKIEVIFDYPAGIRREFIRLGVSGHKVSFSQ